MRVAIYQINTERDTKRLVFQSWAAFQRQGYQQPPPDIYDIVYTYQAELATAEGVYRRFNMDHPADYMGRSLSVSDIVEIVSDTGERSCFFCDRVGFHPIEFHSFLVGTQGDLQKRLSLLLENRPACGILMQEIGRRVYADDQKPNAAGHELIQAYISKDPDAMLLALTGWELSSLIRLAFDETF